MRTQELIQRLRTESLWADQCTEKIMDLCMEAAEVLECVFGSGEEEINLCICCTHIEQMDQCKMDVGCSHCDETGCPCQNCHGGSNWELLGSKYADINAQPQAEPEMYTLTEDDLPTLQSLMMPPKIYPFQRRESEKK